LEEDKDKKYQRIIKEIDKLFEEEQIVQEKKLSIFKPNIRSNLIGLIIFLSGIFTIIYPKSTNLNSLLNYILTNPNDPNIKIGLGLILIGLFLIILIYEKSSENLIASEKNPKSKKIKLLMSEKITITFSLWVILLLFLNYTISLEVFLILMFIGILVTKELTDYYTTPNLKKRINIFLFVFLIIFLIIISQKIINVF
jgi:hypothetical protein